MFQTYLKKILKPFGPPYAEAVEKQLIYIDDNVSPHRPNIVKNWKGLWLLSHEYLNFGKLQNVRLFLGKTKHFSRIMY